MEDTTEGLIQMNVEEVARGWAEAKGFMWHKETCDVRTGQFQACCNCGLQALFYRTEGAVTRLIQLSIELEGG